LYFLAMIVVAFLFGCGTENENLISEIKIPTVTISPILTDIEVVTATSYPTPTATPTKVFSPTPHKPEPSPTPPKLDPSGIYPDGPWLIYTIGYSDGLAIVNHDGSYGTPLIVRTYDPAQSSEIRDDSNDLVVINHSPWLVRHHQALAYDLLPSWTPEGGPSFFDIDFTGDDTRGFLASILRADREAIPELLIHELPSGELLSRLSLVRCPDHPDACETWESAKHSQPIIEPYSLVGGLRQFRWSPNGHELAFAALWDGPSTDLYLYDAITDGIRRLTAGPNHIGKIFWSPGGKWVVFESLSALDGSTPPEQSLWAVAVDGNQARHLYSYPWSGYGQNILGWLDEDRFVSHNGYLPVEDMGLVGHLRLVNITSSEAKTLFEGEFLYAEIDLANEVVATYSHDGVNLISSTDPQPIYVGGSELQHHWEEDPGMFVTVSPCDDDPRGRKAITSDGQLHCLREKSKVEVINSPNGQLRIVTGDGIWLQRANGEPVNQVMEEDTGKVIWRKDSEGFFLAVNNELYYVQVQDLALKMIDGQISPDFTFKWLEADVP
jgi:hypothetical protein